MTDFTKNLITSSAILLTSYSSCVTIANAQDVAANDKDEIIVTARRRQESLQDVPVAVTAINASQIESKAAVDIQDLAGAAPNLQITQQNSGAAATNLSIRGLTYADVEKSQEPTVGVVIDGVFIGTSTGQLLDFFDIEQIEVLRGPQGTLFGRNTIGGVINIRRSRPTISTSGKYNVSYGSFNTLSFRGVQNFALAPDLGVKFWYFHNESDGFYDHAILNEKVGGNNKENYGVSILYAPENGFEALVTLEQQEQNFDVINGNITNSSELFSAFMPPNEVGRNTTSDLYTVFGDVGVSEYKAPSVTAELGFDIGNIRVTSITAYKESDEFQTQDFDASSSDLFFTLRDQKYNQFSQEFRINGELSSSLDYVAGLYYFDSEYTLVQDTEIFGGLVPTDTDSGTVESIAIFADMNWSLTEEIRLNFGGRFTEDKKTLSNVTTGVFSGFGEDSFDKFTPKIGIDWRPNDDLLVYASYSQGFRSGGFSPRAATQEFASIAYEPETVDSYEIGAKFSALDNRFKLNTAAFLSDYQDFQQNTTVPGGPTGNQTITSNVGNAEIKGFEADFTFTATDKFTFGGTLGLLDAEFKSFDVILPDAMGALAPFDFSANNLIYSPEFSGSFYVDYEQPTSFGSVNANASLRHIGSYDQQISTGPVSLVNGVNVVDGNDPRVQRPSVDLLDASLTANFELGGADAKFGVYGRNLLDEEASTAAFTVAGLFAFSSALEPASYGVTFGVKY
ncbi:TonB-dependent receptor [Litorimonas sp.]|uniref:TonB-dependent receptor n=1 Tax=Litorimonas sp. TaxID=1892381 RepID=UPI003A872575